MEILSAHSWNEKMGKKYPNGYSINKIMDSYAKYYHEAMIDNYFLRGGEIIKKKKRWWKKD